MRHLLALLLLFATALCARAGEPFLKPNDVIALIGGEDMVVANELGYLETLLQRNLPDYHLKVRSLAWEGDTVFEQHRDLNYPTLEAQLDRIGATVIVCQFGQAESLAGLDGVEKFGNTYAHLVERLSSHGKRRVVIMGPTPFGKRDSIPANANDRLKEYAFAAEKWLATRGTYENLYNLVNHQLSTPGNEFFLPQTRDGLHLSEKDHQLVAREMAIALLNPRWEMPWPEQLFKNGLGGLRKLIQEKNRLWFQYTRPQNWAFLAGDRTNQPSSRDYKDLSKRWFPDEMEQFVPLIEAKDKEIWDLAASLPSTLPQK